jgi:hypothetical protein
VVMVMQMHLRFSVMVYQLYRLLLLIILEVETEMRWTDNHHVAQEEEIIETLVAVVPLRIRMGRDREQIAVLHSEVVGTFEMILLLLLIETFPMDLRIGHLPEISEAPVHPLQEETFEMTEIIETGVMDRQSQIETFVPEINHHLRETVAIHCHSIASHLLVLGPENLPFATVSHPSGTDPTGMGSFLMDHHETLETMDLEIHRSVITCHQKGEVLATER